MKNKFFKLSCIALLLCTSSLFAANSISEEQCEAKDSDTYIFAGGECIEYYLSEGDVESEITIVIPGTWPEGTNTLGRYAPFADNLSMSTDITTIAIALPGYSNSSTNRFPALSHDEKTHLAGKKEYISFVSQLIQKLQERYEATKINYIGHSAGAMIGATLTGFTPGLLDTLTSAGGRYDIHEENPKGSDLISLVDYIDQVDQKTQFLLVYGTKDTISLPQVTKDFYHVLQKKGLNATLVEVKDAPHLDLDMTDSSVEAIVEMLEKE